METRKVLSSLSYFSVLFAGFIFPLIVFFVAEDKIVKDHAKKAFWSHLIPVIPVPFIIFSAVTQLTDQTEIPVMFIATVILTVILSLIVLIWNIIKGIQIIVKESN